MAEPKPTKAPTWPSTYEAQQAFDPFGECPWDDADEQALGLDPHDGFDELGDGCPF